MSTWFCEFAWAGGEVASDVVIRADGGRVTQVEPGVAGPPAGATRLRGLTLPAFANGHSHAFHRALRGRTHLVPDAAAARGSGSFWTWREQMYRVAERLDPDTYHQLARAVFVEMVLAGYGVVGEFHYLHHASGGRPYADPNAMGAALIAAADDAGIRLTLLDTCYLAAGVRGEPPSGVQRRFSDGDAAGWAGRAGALRGSELVRIGAAVHSVRAVPPAGIRAVAEWSRRNEAPLHVHLSEQPRENQDCLDAHGRSPAALLDESGALGPLTTAVHATHLSDDDVDRLARSGARVCVTRTTERDLADGAPRLGDLVAAESARPDPADDGPADPADGGRADPAAAPGRPGIRLTIGSDSNAVVDPFEETRALELDERVRTLRRGHLASSALLETATREGYASLGWPRHDGAAPPASAPPSRGRAGGIRVGDLVDLTVVSLGSVRLAGWTPGALLDQVVFAATASDVTDVIVAGRRIVRDGAHRSIEEPAAALHTAIRALLAD
ncbi:formimidoylglutamate deiminase [Myceligenerans crystallogenes]|uniref:Formimidoylglutamate deiminase n=1 Tax=Myceligenerans crystallogenes TaxID=316335 RepID=A0ABN2NCP2_9MICO